MRAVVRPPVSEAELSERTPHEIVRDFPETLTVFRRRSVDLGRCGGRPLGDLDAAGGAAGTESPDGPKSLLASLTEAIRWRRALHADALEGDGPDAGGGGTSASSPGPDDEAPEDDAPGG